MHHDIVNVDQVVSMIKGTEKIIFDEKLVGDFQLKGRADYVTQVDIRVQDHIQKKLEEAYPDVGFIGEESRWTKHDPKGRYWILDPIDGTTNLLHHYHMSAVSLAFYESGKVTFGVVYNPFLKEMFIASDGQGAFLNGERIHVSDVSKLNDALVSYGATPYEKDRAPYLFRVYEKIYMASADYRRCGSAALDLCYVACGRVDLYLEQQLKPWDYAAGLLIVREAGGCVDPWNEEGRIDILDRADIIAHNGLLQKEIYNILRGI